MSKLVKIAAASVLVMYSALTLGSPNVSVYVTNYCGSQVKTDINGGMHEIAPNTTHEVSVKENSDSSFKFYDIMGNAITTNYWHNPGTISDNGNWKNHETKCTHSCCVSFSGDNHTATYTLR